MMKLFLLFLLVVGVNASTFSLQTGEVRAHTEVFGDSTIDPKSTKINSVLLMSEKIESLKGSISLNAMTLVSDNLDRDEHMYEALEVKEHTHIAFHINSLVKKDKNYILLGTFVLNGTQHEISSVAIIKQENNSLSLEGSFSIKMSDFNIKPPTMLFLTVRDRVDITYSLKYKEEKE